MGKLVRAPAWYAEEAGQRGGHCSRRRTLAKEQSRCAFCSFGRHAPLLRGTRDEHRAFAANRSLRFELRCQLTQRPALVALVGLGQVAREARLPIPQL
jgi:hypothetical protein